MVHIVYELYIIVVHKPHNLHIFTVDACFYVQLNNDVAAGKLHVFNL